MEFNAERLRSDMACAGTPKSSYTEAERAEKYICAACGYVYAPAEHDGVSFEELPDDWRCMRCRRSILNFAKA